MTAATEGVLVGQWGFVWAAYIVTWVFIASYALSLWIRAPRGGSNE
jgi:hypothetical protein